MTTQLSTKSRSVHPLLGVWKLDETVPVLFEILLHTISTLWAEASVSLTLWSTKCSLDHFKISMQYRSFLRFFIYIYIYTYISCHKWAVYADRANTWNECVTNQPQRTSAGRLANTSLRAPVVRRLVPNALPCHTRHGALMLSHVYFGALRHCNTQINIRGRGNAHKCFKICDEYCSYRLLANHLITNWNWRQGRRLAMTSI